MKFKLSGIAMVTDEGWIVGEHADKVDHPRPAVPAHRDPQSREIHPHVRHVVKHVSEYSDMELLLLSEAVEVERLRRANIHLHFLYNEEHDWEPGP